MAEISLKAMLSAPVTTKVSTEMFQWPFHSVDPDLQEQSDLGPHCLQLNNAMQLFAADDFSRRDFHMHFCRRFNA